MYNMEFLWTRLVLRLSVYMVKSQYNSLLTTLFCYVVVIFTTTRKIDKSPVKLFGNALDFQMPSQTRFF